MNSPFWQSEVKTVIFVLGCTKMKMLLMYLVKKVEHFQKEILTSLFVFVFLALCFLLVQDSFFFHKLNHLAHNNPSQEIIIKWFRFYESVCPSLLLAKRPKLFNSFFAFVNRYFQKPSSTCSVHFIPEGCKIKCIML